MRRSVGWPAKCLAMLFFLMLNQPAAAQRVALQTGDYNNNIPTFVYDPHDGNITVFGDGLTLTTLEIFSTQSLFAPQHVNDGVLSSPFDVFTPAKFFHLNTSGFESLDIGPVLPPGLSFDSLRNDLVFSGSVHPAGLLPGVDAPVPEPAGWLMALVLLPMLARFARHSVPRRHTSPSPSPLAALVGRGVASSLFALG